MPLAAVIQLTSTSDTAANLAQAEALIRQAASYGATFVATPEATPYLGPHDRKVALAESLDGPTNAHFAALARELQIELLLGSTAERLDDQRAYNTSLLYGADGSLKAFYRKIHLFDVDLARSGGVSFLESARTAPGEDVVVADTALGRLGMSVCYDLRFPELYRRATDQGATVLAVPSAFTLMTGKDHWHVLLRARAIETQCWLLAPAQYGAHDDAGLRRSYGHSLIIDPWGTIVAECGDAPGIALAEIDPGRVAAVRAQIPVGSNRRLC